MSPRTDPESLRIGEKKPMPPTTHRKTRMRGRSIAILAALAAAVVVKAAVPSVDIACGDHGQHPLLASVADRLFDDLVVARHQD